MIGGAWGRTERGWTRQQEMKLRTWGASLVSDGGEARNDGCLHSGSAQEVGAGEVAHVMSDLKE